MEWFNRVYACTQHDGYYKCQKFATEEAADLHNYMFNKYNVQAPLIYMCRFTPALFDRTILKFKLKEPILLWDA